jgi:hypothetical protein
VVYAYAPFEGDGDPDPAGLRASATKTFTWYHRGGDYTGGASEVAASGFEVPITKAIATEGRSAAFLAEFIYSYDEVTNEPDYVLDADGAGAAPAVPTTVEVTDVSKEPFWSPAHVVESDGLSGRSYVTAHCLETGSRYWDFRADTRAYQADNFEPAQATPVSYELNGEVHTLFPATVFRGSSIDLAETTVDGTFHAVLFRTVAGRSGALRVRDGDILTGGIIKHALGKSVIQGFTGPPAWVQLFYETLNTGGGLSGGDATDDSATIKLCATMEYADENGRLWRSAPCVARDVVLPAIVGTTSYHHEITVAFSAHSGMPSPAAGCKIVLYGTNPNEETFYRRGEQFVMPGEFVSWTWGENGYTDARASTETLYTTGDVLANGCPPAAQFMTEANGRIWAGGGIDKSVIQASKPLNDLLGVEWNSLDSFKVFLPGDATGIASMDNAVIAFTRDGIYAVHGPGPDLGGVGSFSEPQLIPSVAGCINHRSVISTQEGVFFQSQRGLELLGRGFSSPRFAGESVRDTVNEYPYCFGVEHSQRDGLIRWLFGASSTGSAAAVVVYDTRAQGWYTFTYTGMGFRHISRIDGDIVMSSLTLGSTEAEAQTEALDEGVSDISRIETGSIRLSGVQGWAFGRRIHLLGEFGGRACDVTIRVAFNDAAYNPDHFFTWSLTSSEYGTDVPIELELTLPIQKFSTIRFKIEVNPTGETGSYSFKPNGITLYHSSANEGPRLGSRNAG